MFTPKVVKSSTVSQKEIEHYQRIYKIERELEKTRDKTRSHPEN
jgi:hypothetical protein